MADKETKTWKSKLWRVTKYLAGSVLVGVLGINDVQDYIGGRIRKDLRLSEMYSSSAKYLSSMDMGDVNRELNGYTLSWRDLKKGVEYTLGLVSLDSFKITEDTKKIVDTRTKQKKGDMGRLEELLKSFDGGENVAKDIILLIGKLNGRGYDTKSFEEKFGRIETRNMEKAYFIDQVARPVIIHINQKCQNGCTEEDMNHVAVNAGLIFARNIRPTKELDLESETQKLSDHVSAGLKYRVDFSKCLPTSK